ncbi:MAG: signal peptide peptidase SppA [Thermodesulfobacteriota bacterium]
MKKSRTGVTIIFLLVLTAVFIIVAGALSIVLRQESSSSSWADVFGFGTKVGVVKIEGAITSSDDTLKQLREYRKKSSVKAVVLRINSPGGAVAPAQEIYREIERTRQKKPVVASIETVGASAAYYIASAADRIVCSDGSITGSIGVIMMLPQLQELIQKLGVDVNVIKAGKYKDIGSTVRPLTDEERKILENFADEIHDQFIHDVAAGRKGKIDEQKLRSVADGRFFTGKKAMELGLVDTIGNFYDAVKLAGNLGGIEGEVDVLYPKKRWDNYLDLFLESASRGIVRASEHLRLIQRTPEIR